MMAFEQSCQLHSLEVFGDGARSCLLRWPAAGRGSFCAFCMTTAASQLRFGELPCASGATRGWAAATGSCRRTSLRAWGYRCPLLVQSCQSPNVPARLGLPLSVVSRTAPLALWDSRAEWPDCTCSYLRGRQFRRFSPYSCLRCWRRRWRPCRGRRRNLCKPIVDVDTPLATSFALLRKQLKAARRLVNYPVNTRFTLT